jgi:hypothetical protein
LLLAGLDPDADRFPQNLRLKSAIGHQIIVPRHQVDLWLLSNRSAIQGAPFCMPLIQGYPFRDITQLPDPELHRPLIGMRALRQAGLRVEIDFAHDTVSIWTPDPPAIPP